MTVREQCFEIYRSAFGDSGEFDIKLFDLFFDRCEYIESDGEIAAMLFALPCTLYLDGARYPCRYIYAAATAHKYRSQGYMSRLLGMLSGTLILKPATDSLVEFYQKRGFASFNAVREKLGRRCVEVDEKFELLSGGGNCDRTPFTVMAKSVLDLNLDGLCFAYTME